MSSSDHSAESLRGTPRSKVFQPAQMTVGAVTRRVHLLDLSRSGALVHAADPPAVGTVVRLTVDTTLGLARVMWRRGDRFGVAFPTPLDQQFVNKVIDPHGTRLPAGTATTPLRRACG